MRSHGVFCSSHSSGANSSIIGIVARRDTVWAPMGADLRGGPNRAGSQLTSGLTSGRPTEAPPPYALAQAK